jgi:hypothetical protein
MLIAKRILRYIVIILLVCIGYIVINKLVIGQAFVQRDFQNNLPEAGLEPISQHVAESKDTPIPITVPEGTGHVVEGYTAGAAGGKARVIIHIQDIHTNYEAQKNLSRMLEAMIKNNNLRLIMVEGGWGNVNLSYLRAYADLQRRSEVAEEYLKQGKISGEEYLDIISDYDILIEGIEQESLYKANLDVFFEIEQFRQEAAIALEALKKIIDALKHKIYSAQLLEMEKTKQAYDNEKITLADYYLYLALAAKKEHIDINAYPSLKAFMGIIEAEKNISFPAVEKERSLLIEKLSKILSKQDLAELVTKSLEFRLNKLTPAQYHDYLLVTAKSAGESCQKYKNLMKYLEYIKSHESINTARLFEEADALLYLLESRLTKNDRQRRLYHISTSARVLDNFLQLKLVPSDFKYYKQNRNMFLTANWVDFLNEQAAYYKLNVPRAVPAVILDKNLATLVRFYDLANERDDAFISNALMLMERESADIAVLIAGGFHTPNLKQKFKENNISFIVAAPQTTQQTDPEQYRYILKYKSGKEE